MLSIALAPMLLLSVVQSILIFQREVSQDRAELVVAAERSAATFRARIDSAAVLLHTLASEPVASPCAGRLADIRNHIPGYDNLIRFDADGDAACSAAPAPADPQRREREWFRVLASGAPLSVTMDPGAPYAREPILVVSVPTLGQNGRFAGALSAVITLSSLRPETDDRSLPAPTEAALVDGEGRYLTATRASAFPADPASHLAGKGGRRAALWFGKDRAGVERVFTAAPLIDQDIQILLSAPSRDVVAWAWVNPVSAIVLPVLAFGLALAGVWIVADRGVVRWIAYLQRVAGLYAHGRYGVHPQRARWAPPEIRELAQSMDTMASTIAARDRALRDSLVQKDGLLREIHHRVKNNLQVISSLLNMQQRSLTDPAARAAMSDTRQRITALALIYRALYEGPDLRKVNLRDFLEDLIAQLVMNDSGTRSNIRTDLTIDAVSIDPDHLAPLALFAVEAITNAKKHGLGDAGGQLTVTFRVQGASAELAITDSGRPGPSPAVVGEGVGRTLMLAFARQLGGDVAFCPETKGGLTARLTFPTPMASAPA